MSLDENIRFSELSGLFERISKTKGLNDKRDLFYQFLYQWRKRASELKLKRIMINEEALSFYPVMRLMLPQLDKKRSAYDIREYRIAKIYCELLCLSKDNVDAQRLLKFKSPDQNKSTINFPQLVYEIIRNRFGNKGCLTIKDINDKLDNLANASGSDKKTIIQRELLFILQNTSALDQKWLIRIILKDMRFGFSYKQIFQCYHANAEQFYNVTNDLAGLCMKFVEESNETMEDINICLYRPFKPMLGERCKLDSIFEQMQGTKFIIELKYDGERVMLHKCGESYRYWSRSGLEWTKTYGRNGSDGTLTKCIHEKFKETVVDCILDGEMMGFNEETQTMGTKNDNFDVKSANIFETSGYLPCFIIFDVVWLNGQLLTKKSLLERKKILNQEILVEEIKGKIQIGDWTIGNSEKEVVDAFNEALSNCEEGLVLKAVDSQYCANTRKGGWFKLKPDYVLGLHEEIDCVVVGAYYGKTKKFREFLCAVKENDSRFLSFCKAGTGFSRKMLYQYNLHLKQYCRTVTKDNPLPNWLILAGRSRMSPDVVIDPAKSFIVQLKAAEIINSVNYATGCTLRFTRVDCVRDDKRPVEDCMTVEQLQQLRQLNHGKLAVSYIPTDSDRISLPDSMVSPCKIRKKDKLAKVLPNCQSTVPSKIKQEDYEGNSTLFNNLFQQKEFCIMLSNTQFSGYTKQDFERFLYDNGAAIVQNPTRRTFAVVPDKISLKVKNLMRTGQYDLIKPDWLVQCMSQMRYLQPQPTDFIFMRSETARDYTKWYDRLGDSFTEEFTQDKFKEFIKSLDHDKLQIGLLNYTEKSEFIDDYGLSALDSNFLNGCVLYFFESTNISSNTPEANIYRATYQRLQINTKLSGAKIVNQIDRGTLTHIVVKESLLTNEDKLFLHEENNSRSKRFYLIKVEWLENSLRDKYRLKEQPFLVQVSSK